MNRYRTTIVLVLGALALVACDADVPTQGLIVTTTAKQLEPVVASARTSQGQCDVPENRHLLVTATERQDICYENCDCPPPTPPTGPLTQTEQQQLMQDLVHEGAKGFVHTTTAINMGACACIAGWDWLEPIDQLPFIWTFANIDHEFNVWLRCADPDGTVMAAIDGVTYSFRPGDAWQATYETGPDPSDPVQCPSGYRGRWVQVLSFRNDGLLDQSQFPPLGVPTPTPLSPSPTVPAATRTPEPPTAISPAPTPVPIAAWLAEGIPPDTFIRYRVAQPVDFSTLVDISADGTVSSAFGDPMSSGQWVEGAGRITQDELKALLLKFAEVDFFGHRVKDGACVYRASHPPDPSLDRGETPYLPPVGLCITLHGTGKAILYNPGFTVPCDAAVLSTEASPQGRGGALAELEDMIQEIGRRVARESSAATPQPASTLTPTATPPPGAPPPPDSVEALVLIYGDALSCPPPVEGAEPVCQRRWPEALTDSRFEGVFSTDLLTTRVLLGVPYRQQGQDRYLVFTSSNEEANTCHACGPVLDGAVLSWVDGRWELTSLTQGVLNAGVWGEPPYEVKGLRVGPDKQGALFMVTDYGQGVLSGAAYVVAPVDDGLRTVLRVQLSGDNHSDCCNEDGYPCYAYDSIIKLQPGGNPDYYDLRVTTHGTALTWPAGEGDPFIAPVDGVELYRFSEGRYTQE